MARQRDNDGNADEKDAPAQLWRRVTADVRPITSGPRNRLTTSVHVTETVETLKVDVLERPKKTKEHSSDKPSGKTPAVADIAVEAWSLTGHFSPRVSVKPAGRMELEAGFAPGVDKRTLTKLRRGLIPIEARIDLHNMTQAEAHAALGSFLRSCQMQGRRCVLVITGKGYRTEGRIGVLKSGVPRWLNEPEMRGCILAFVHAPPAEGGEGALRILLRRRRDETIER